MKICFISEAKSIHTQRWTEGLAKTGCDLHLISSSVADIPNVTLHHMPIYSPNPVRQTINKYRIKQLIRRLNPDITHIFGLFAVSSLGAMGLIKNLKNLLISVWGSDVVPTGDDETIKEKVIKTYLLNKADCLVATSAYLALTVQHYMRRQTEIEILPWGVDLDVFRPTNELNDNDIVTIGFAKRLHPLSGPDILLKAFNYACNNCNQKLRLKIAGDGPMRLELLETAVQMDLSDFIEWTGWLDSPASLSEFYRSLDLFVMPSRRESFGVSAVEASASGVVGVASNFGGIPEIIVDGVTGLLVEPDDVKGFGNAIVTLAKNEVLRKDMGSKGRKRAEIEFNWNNSLNRMLKIYNQVYANS
ncbi:MAG: glycosyltransferase family 4 protein [bacterium]|nr:MAG: glycosyltransferase family 4 protein [bacterium]